MSAEVERKPLRVQYGRPVAWREEQAPVVTFWLDEQPTCLAFPFFSLGAAEYVVPEQHATFAWPDGTILVKGPKSLEFFEQFCRHHATGVKADGKDIVSVTFQPAEQ